MNYTQDFFDIQELKQIPEIRKTVHEKAKEFRCIIDSDGAHLLVLNNMAVIKLLEWLINERFEIFENIEYIKSDSCNGVYDWTKIHFCNDEYWISKGWKKNKKS